jgi:AAA domain
MRPENGSSWKDRRMSESVVVLITGLPGAGKTTLIDRAAQPPEWTVVDTDRLRRRLPPVLRRVPVFYPLHVVVMLAAIARHRHVVVQSRGTYWWFRRLIAASAHICGRGAVLILLDAAPADAMADQVRRGRVAPAAAMDWHISHWNGMLEAAASGALGAEGWNRVIVLDRPQASDVKNLGDLTSDLVLGPSPGSPAETRYAAVILAAAAAAVAWIAWARSSRRLPAN